jgi:5-(carboxyamino)imidazole ribonucleotide synthase
VEAFRSLFPLQASEAIHAPGPALAIAKTLRGGYDGKGQVVVREPADFERVLPLLPCVLEEALDLAFEASVITARTQQGNMQSFPVFENIHVNNILDTTLFPSPSLPRGQGREGGAAEVLLRVAESCAHRLDLAGLLTTEFFLSRTPSRGLFAQGGLAAVPGTSLFFGINEFAPRPHNSGHVTREACFVSQFDALARVLLNLPLPLLEPVSAELFAMGNLLGDVWISQGQTRGDLAADAAEAPGDALSLAPWASAPHVLAITLYGKETARMGRKMGHFTLKSPQARSEVTEFREALARACVTLSRV